MSQVEFDHLQPLSCHSAYIVLYICMFSWLTSWPVCQGDITSITGTVLAGGGTDKVMIVCLLVLIHLLRHQATNHVFYREEKTFIYEGGETLDMLKAR